MNTWTWRADVTVILEMLQRERGPGCFTAPLTSFPHAHAHAHAASAGPSHRRCGQLIFLFLFFNFVSCDTQPPFFFYFFISFCFLSSDKIYPALAGNEDIFITNQILSKGSFFCSRRCFSFILSWAARKASNSLLPPGTFDISASHLPDSSIQSHHTINAQIVYSFLRSLRCEEQNLKLKEKETYARSVFFYFLLLFNSL